MPASYGCDNCEVTADSLDGWLIVSVQYMYMDPNQPTPPGGRTLASTAPDLMFHNATCRDAWCEQANLTPPTTTTP
jgi:hypothetical protein